MKIQPKVCEWIPCNNENLPDKNVLCCNKYGEQMIGYVFYDETSSTGFSAENEHCYMQECVAWMPLPEPYDNRKSDTLVIGTGRTEIETSNEIKKGYVIGSREPLCAIYFSSMNARLNAASRDALNDPDYVRIWYENGEIIIKSGSHEDYKVNKSKNGQRFISGSAFMGRVADIPQKEKIYGAIEKDGLHFPVPKEYQK